MALLEFPATDIDIAGLPVDAELPRHWLDEELRDTEVCSAAPGHITARLSRTGDDIVVRGQVNAAVSLPCARCLEPTQVAVTAELSLLLKMVAVPHHHAGRSSVEKPSAANRAEESEYEFAAGEADVDTYDGETVVLDPFVREAILLEVPNFPLCSDDCPGIGPAAAPADVPSTEPRLDPRLLPLRSLRERLEAGKQNGRVDPTKTVPKKNKE
jgi:uncharacterized protein